MKTLLLILALSLTGCSALEQMKAFNPKPPVFYPTVCEVNDCFSICEVNESLLICNDSTLTSCVGYLDDKPLIIEETEL